MSDQNINDPFSHRFGILPINTAEAPRGNGPGKTRLLVVPEKFAGDAARFLPPKVNTSHSGAPKEALPEVGNAFSTKQVAQVRSLTPKKDFWLPNWVREHVNKKSSPETVIKEVAERLKAHPSEETLLESQTILNELSREPKLALLIRQTINREFIKQVVSHRK